MTKNNIPELHRVFLAVNNECNGSCIYCANPAKNEPALSLDKIIEAIDGIADLGAKELAFTGGEPLLRVDLPDIVGYASEKDLKILIATNGILLTPDLLLELAKPNVAIQVSLDSTDRNINDALRGTGAYESAMKAIDLCKKYEVPLQISTTVTNMNYQTIPEVIDFGLSNGNHVKLRQFVAKGRGKEIREDLIVDDEQLEELLTKYVLNPAYAGRVSAEQMPFHQKENGSYRCSAGNSIMHIFSDGSVGPCPSVDEAVGNIFSKPLREIWENYFDAFRNENYRPPGFCGREKILLNENNLSPVVGAGSMMYNAFALSGCKCTG